MSTYFTLSDLAERIGGQLVGPPDVKVYGVSASDEPKQGTVIFVEKDAQAQQITEGSVAAALTPLDAQCCCPSIRVAKPRVAFAIVLDLFYPAKPLAPGVHPTASIDPTALVDPLAWVGPFCIVGPKCLVEAGACLVARVTLGEGTRIHPGVHVDACVRVGTNCEIGSDCWLEPHAIVGAKTTTGDHVYIGSRCVLHSGCKIGRGCKIDNRASVGRDAEVGSHCILVSGSLVGENARLGAYCVIAAGSVIGPGVVLAPAVQIAGWSTVLEDVLDKGHQMAGEPAVSFRLELQSRTLRSKGRESYQKLLALRELSLKNNGGHRSPPHQSTLTRSAITGPKPTGSP